MKPQFSIGGVAQNAAPQSLSAQSDLEQRLHGLSDSELVQLRELLDGRISKLSPAQSARERCGTEDLNFQRLTARESEVLTLVASGYTRPEVAATLNISRNTAATHVANIYRKLEVESIAEATMLAFRWGIVS